MKIGEVLKDLNFTVEQEKLFMDALTESATNKDETAIVEFLEENAKGNIEEDVYEKLLATLIEKTLNDEFELVEKKKDDKSVEDADKPEEIKDNVKNVEDEIEDVKDGEGEEVSDDNEELENDKKKLEKEVKKAKSESIDENNDVIVEARGDAINDLLRTVVIRIANGMKEITDTKQVDKLYELVAKDLNEMLKIYGIDFDPKDKYFRSKVANHMIKSAKHKINSSFSLARFNKDLSESIDENNDVIVEDDVNDADREIRFDFSRANRIGHYDAFEGRKMDIRDHDTDDYKHAYIQGYKAGEADRKSGKALNIKNKQPKQEKIENIKDNIKDVEIEMNNLKNVNVGSFSEGYITALNDIENDSVVFEHDETVSEDYLEGYTNALNEVKYENENMPNDLTDEYNPSVDTEPTDVIELQNIGKVEIPYEESFELGKLHGKNKTELPIFEESHSDEYKKGFVEGYNEGKMEIEMVEESVNQSLLFVDYKVRETFKTMLEGLKKNIEKIEDVITFVNEKLKNAVSESEYDNTIQLLIVEHNKIHEDKIVFVTEEEYNKTSYDKILEESEEQMIETVENEVTRNRLVDLIESIEYEDEEDRKKQIKKLIETLTIKDEVKEDEVKDPYEGYTESEKEVLKLFRIKL